jgi:hypothetical protein
MHARIGKGCWDYYCLPAAHLGVREMGQEMKILKPIAASKVPAKSRNWRRNGEYDAIFVQAEKLAVSKVLPVECEDLTRGKSVYAALRHRQKLEGLDHLDIYRIDKTIYLERVK